MTGDRMKVLLEELDTMSKNTMAFKNETQYATVDEDKLHNFKRGAEIAGGNPAEAALWYMAKHLSALVDKVHKEDFTNRDDFAEKCQDIINYVRFIWLLGNEVLDERGAKEVQPDD